MNNDVSAAGTQFLITILRACGHPTKYVIMYRAGFIVCLGRHQSSRLVVLLRDSQPGVLIMGLAQ